MMRKHFLIGAALLAASSVATAAATDTRAQYRSNLDGGSPPGFVMQQQATDNLSAQAVGPNSPLYVICSSGCAGGTAPTNYSLETGGNLAAIKTDLDSILSLHATAALQTTGNTSLAAIATAAGTPTDAAYTGSGSPSIVGVLKGLWNQLAASLIVGGNVASGAADSGNPVKVGAVYNSTLPTLTNGQRADLQIGTRGSLDVTLLSQDNTIAIAAASTNSDGFATSAAASHLQVQAIGVGYNNTTLERLRSNTDSAALVTLTTAGAGTTNSADQTNYNGRGVQVGLNITTAGGTPTLTCSIQGKDSASAVYYNILTSAAIGTTGFTNLTVYPGAAVTTNVSAAQPLPRTWRISCTVGGVTPSVSATIGASVIL